MCSPLMDLLLPERNGGLKMVRLVYIIVERCDEVAVGDSYSRFEGYGGKDVEVVDCDGFDFGQRLTASCWSLVVVILFFITNKN